MTAQMEITSALDELLGAFAPGAASPAHAAKVEWFKAEVLRRERRTTPAGRELEIKEERLRSHGGHTYYLVEVGMAGDERTAASIFCRNRHHIVIGRRLGVRLLNAKSKHHLTRKPLAGWFNAIHAVTQ